MASEKKSGILFLGNFLSSQYGTRGISEDISGHLQERGWTVFVASSKPGRVSRLLDMVKLTLSRREFYQVACIEVYSGLAFVWAELMAGLLRRIRKPYVVSLHGGRLPDFAIHWPGRVRRVFLAADMVITPSRYIQGSFLSIREDIQYLPNAIAISNYPFRQRSQPRPDLMWLRAFHRIYNPLLSVRVLENLNHDFQDANLQMIGPDNRDGSLEAVRTLVNESGLQDRLRIVGPVPKSEVPAWLNQGDIFLNTTRYESFGVAVLEAAACGLPVVSTRVGEMPYLWQDGLDILLVPEADPQAMADAVRRILTEPGLAACLSSNARRKAEKFDWELILPQWHAIFSDLINR